MKTILLVLALLSSLATVSAQTRGGGPTINIFQGLGATNVNTDQLEVADGRLQILAGAAITAIPEVASASNDVCVLMFARIVATNAALVTRLTAATNDLSSVLTTLLTAATNDLSGVLVTRMTAGTNDLSTILVTRLIATNAALVTRITAATNDLTSVLTGASGTKTVYTANEAGDGVITNVLTLVGGRITEWTP